ncbi:hypothetical protein [Collimonas sp. OK307]|uniref:hypothetical protein n=1 Tax=Collimonas sp. OK307 TaxID=1801620 RepID=UPI001587BD81|nr:hypothetical protein [Collimonas sp. OK307]
MAKLEDFDDIWAMLHDFFVIVQERCRTMLPPQKFFVGWELMLRKRSTYRKNQAKIKFHPFIEHNLRFGNEYLWLNVKT